MWDSLLNAIGIRDKAIPPSQHASSKGVVLGGNNAGFINTGEFNGNLVIVQGQSYVCNLHIPFSSDLTGASPAKLLRWSSRLPKQLVGRSEELAKLRDWASCPATLSCAVIEGGAGVGKTRLAFELADALRQQGWQAGQLSDPSAPVAFASSEQGALLILDYPEEQPSAVEKFFEGVMRSGASMQACLPKLRVLLLCRQYAGLQPHHHFLSVEGAQGLLPMRLQALAEQEPWELFQQATQAFAPFQEERTAGAPLSEQDFQQWLGIDAAHGSALLVQTLALSQTYKPGVAQPADKLIADLLMREHEHFLKRCKALAWADELQRGAWALQLAAGIAGKLSFDEINELHRVFSAHGNGSAALGGRALPSQAQWRKLLGDSSLGLQAIEPDLFAAHALHSAALMPDASIMAPALIPKLLNWREDDPQAYSTVLEDRLNRLARLNWDRPSVQRSSPDPWIQAVMPRAQQGAASPIWQAALSRQPLPPSLLLLSIAMNERLVLRLDENLGGSPSAEQRNHLASSLNNLSVRLADAGQREQGLAAIRRAVEIREKLAAENFAAYAPDLAGSLNNLSNHLAEAGQREQGLAAIRRAVDIYEKLAAENFAAYAPALASSLNNLSNRLAEAGQREQGLAAAERACELIASFAKPNTTYADWQTVMLRQRDTLRALQDASKPF